MTAAEADIIVVGGGSAGCVGSESAGGSGPGAPGRMSPLVGFASECSAVMASPRKWGADAQTVPGVP